MRTLTMREFGNLGRFGNQLFQYAFLRTYANKHNCQLQLPAWVGNELFGTMEPKPTADLKTYKSNSSGLKHGTPPTDESLVNRDFEGYTQYHTSYYAQFCKQITEMFCPVPKILRRLFPAADRLREGAETIVGIHLRRGDYGRNIFPITPTAWYLGWLEQHWEHLLNPKLFIATESPELVKEFAAYNPQTMETLGVSLAKEPMANSKHLKVDVIFNNQRAFDFYPDFYLLSQCNILLIPNSTFSFFAAMLAPRLKGLWRACLDAGSFVKVDPWNSYPILRQPVKDYKHLPEIAIQGNRYWKTGTALHSP